MFGEMAYAPHTLYVCKSEKEYDEFGNFVSKKDIESRLCGCRCDDADVRDAITLNGERFFPSYHVVCEKPVDLGGYVVIRRGDGSVRGKGKVVKTAEANYFGLYQIWI